MAIRSAAGAFCPLSRVAPLEHGRPAVPRGSPRLSDRFARFGLALHPDKTRLIEFGRFAAQTRAGAWRRETGDLQLPRLHARLQPDAEGSVHGTAADDASAVAGETARGEHRAAATSARAYPRAGGLPARGRGRTHAVLRRAPQRPAHWRVPPRARPVVARPVGAPQSDRVRVVGAHAPLGGALAPWAPHLSSVP
jgi:hypothetical protein